MKTLQIYGQFHNNLSFSNVSRAFCQWFASKGYQYTIWSTTGLEKIPYVNVSGLPALNSLADVGIFIGYPTTAKAWLKGHPLKVLVTVCETDRIPNDWAAVCNDLDLIIVPSRYVADVFRASGVHKPIEIVQHGVPNMKIRNTFPENKFLHVSGAVSFPARKGTPSLLLAWKEFKKNPTNKVDILYLRMVETENLHKAIQQLDIVDSVKIVDAGTGFDPTYLTQFTAVIQPSRAEGFGMIPLEARVQGVPVILTNCTGHTEHFMRICDTEILTGPSTALNTQGNDLGHAPWVSVDAVLEGLQTFKKDATVQARTQAWAAQFGKKWQWQQTLFPLKKLIVPFLKGKRPSIFGELLGLRGIN